MGDRLPLRSLTEGLAGSSLTGDGTAGAGLDSSHGRKIFSLTQDGMRVIFGMANRVDWTRATWGVVHTRSDGSRMLSRPRGQSAFIS